MNGLSNCNYCYFLRQSMDLKIQATITGPVHLQAQPMTTVSRGVGYPLVLFPEFHRSFMRSRQRPSRKPVAPRGYRGSAQLQLNLVTRD
jgi:hypothetical protein